ncbi:MAG: DUF3301 domain-containing protein [Gammaproteobacteria bacterium]
MSTLALLLIILVAVLVWQYNTQSRDRAIRAARETCKHQDLQFLDGTAALQSIRPVFSRERGPQLQRTYTFDYSEDGIGRRTGCIIMHNTRVASVLLDE